MSKYDKSKNNKDINAQNSLFPPRISADNSSEELNPNAAFSIVKNKIFEMYDIHSEDEKNQK
ncbi:MAG: hypothetical protein Q4D57_01885 [Clostridia bacterium]|nr:hypothetical protein [Clostridia bacterium]